MTTMRSKGPYVLTKDGVLVTEMFEVTFCDLDGFLETTDELAKSGYNLGLDNLQNKGLPVINQECNVAFTGSRRTAKFFEANNYEVRRTATSQQLPIN